MDSSSMPLGTLLKCNASTLHLGNASILCQMNPFAMNMKLKPDWPARAF